MDHEGRYFSVTFTEYDRAGEELRQEHDGHAGSDQGQADAPGQDRARRHGRARDVHASSRQCGYAPTDVPGPQPAVPGGVCGTVRHGIGREDVEAFMRSFKFGALVRNVPPSAGKPHEGQGF